MTYELFSKEILQQAIQQKQKPNKATRIALVGIGHEFKGDDAAGVQIARAIASSERVLSLDAGTAPENFTGQLRAFAPDVVLLVDAALLDQPPGTLYWLNGADISGFSASTHTLPLSLFIHYLTQELGCQIGVIGIQAGHTLFDTPLSPEVHHAINELVNMLNAVLHPL